MEYRYLTFSDRYDEDDARTANRATDEVTIVSILNFMAWATIGSIAVIVATIALGVSIDPGATIFLAP